ncbi:glycosyl hydrolase 115 family protein [Saccharothrix sp. HUAS TT1]|uniref:glycosyl hydrolase 115 family protein n=1 Tax=unclassified Saccharothrix TaxID=2593673 RepID=UPI00345B617B
MTSAPPQPPPALRAPVARATTPDGPSRVDGYVVDAAGPGRFPLVSRGRAATLVVSDADHPGVRRVVGDLRDDLERVTGVRPEVSPTARGDVVVVGTVGRSPLIDAMVERGALDVSSVEGRWETSLQQVVHHPLPGVERAFVIAGSDQRGAIFGAYDVSREIGVSPWHWWADVPPAHRAELHVLPGRHGQGTPAVKYRGFFVNDENPALGAWAPRYFGEGRAPGHPDGFNRHFYARVFETLLRLKANYLWPAVWGRAFAEDDPLNHATAQEYGVVVGTSHEGPMMRGIEEWNRHAEAGVGDPYGGNGEWSFRRNREAVERYWVDGVRRMKDEGFEGVVTLGMRGNGDVGLPDGDGIELMRDILASQREILAREGLSGVPQVQTLYKEVQRYWDQGLRPPADVTVVFCDDNWGNLRKLPAPDLEPRPGGYGLYYHFDYVGGGRSYKWVDTSPLPNVWDQLHQSYEYGVDRLWVVNAGDVKGNELPLQFFLDYAWDPRRWPVERLGEWEERFAAQNFGPAAAGGIAAVLHEYGALQSVRKPELLNRRAVVGDGLDVVNDDRSSPFSLTDYREIERVTERWRLLADEAERIRGALPPSTQDAYFQLVHYPVKATANLYALRLAEFTNLHHAAQGRASANGLADATDARFADDRALSAHYDAVAGGKWRGFQSQPKIGYGDVARYGEIARWQQPERDHRALPDEVFPPVERVELPHVAELGVAIDGSDQWWPASATPAVLPAFSPWQSQPGQYVEVFNRGAIPFEYRISTGVPWLRVDRPQGTVHAQVRAHLDVDWSRAPEGRTTVPITVTGAGVVVTVAAVVENDLVGARGFVEANGYVSVDAADATRVVDGDGVRWVVIPDFGVEAFPVTAPSREPSGPRLEYDLTVRADGPVTVWAHLAPRNPVLTGPGLRYAVSFDDQPPQVVDITAATGADDTAMNPQWERNTSDNVNRTATGHHLGAGAHTLKLWLVDPIVVVRKLVVDTGGLRSSYLGPPRSRRVH